MTIETTPLGAQCNLRCKYCYENPMRDKNKIQVPNWRKIKAQLEKHGGSFTTFGGEPLLIPIDKLEELWKFGYERWGQNNVQTNGSLITDEHILLFRKYNVHVGFSVDGPGVLNGARQSNEKRTTGALTIISNYNLRYMLKYTEIPCSLIITLHRLNASRDKLPILMAWLRDLAKIGLKDARLHFMENDNADDLMLTDDELYDALIELEGMNISTKFDKFIEIRKQLENGDGGCCLYQGCDPLNTGAVQGVGPLGEPLNCGRVNKEGIDYLKATETEPTRSYVLRNTPQEHGGCKDCEYWYACKGHCPGTGLEGDWRNRTVYCSILKRLFIYMIRKYNIKLLNNPSNPSHYGTGHLDVCHEDRHEDCYVDSGHTDGSTHANTPHGDVEHIDKTFLNPIEVRK